MLSIPEHIFKAYDVRGVYPGEINEGAVARIAEALGKHLTKRHGTRDKRQGRKPVIVVGHDARLSSPSLYRAVIRGVQIAHRHAYRQAGTSHIVRAGMITTPMFYFLVNDLRAAGGIMVTASHNPKEYNGIKAVGPKAEPISGEEIFKIVTWDK